MDSSAKSAPKAWPGIIPVKTIRLKLWRACRLRSLQGMSPKDGLTLINCLLVWQFKSGASVCRHKSFKCITSCSGARRWNSTPAAPSHAVTSALLFGLRTRRATDSNSEGTASRSCCRRREHFILCTRKLGGLTFVLSGVTHLSGHLELEVGRYHLRYLESTQLCAIKENIDTSLQGKCEELDPGGRCSPALTGQGEIGNKQTKQSTSLF